MTESGLEVADTLKPVMNVLEGSVHLDQAGGVFGKIIFVKSLFDEGGKDLLVKDPAEFLKGGFVKVVNVWIWRR